MKQLVFVQEDTFKKHVARCQFNPVPRVYSDCPMPVDMVEYSGGWPGTNDRSENNLKNPDQNYTQPNG